MLHEPLDRPGRGVTEGADGVAFHLLGDVEELVDVADLGVTVTKPLHHPPHPAGAFAARRALAAALVLVEIADAADRADDIGRLVHDDDGCGTKPRAERL